MSKTSRIVAWIAAIGVYLLAIWIGWTSAVRSGQPGNYYEYRHLDAIPRYPIDGVIESSAVIIVTLVIAMLFIFGATRRVALRLLALAMLFGMMSICASPLAMHAPPYFAAPIIFMFLVAAWSGAMMIVGVICAVIERVRA